MSEQNKAIVKRVFDEVFNEHRLDLIPELYTEDVCAHDGVTQDELGGHHMMRNLVTALQTAFPKHRYDIDKMIAERDLVCARWTVHHIDDERLPDYKVEGLSLCEFRDGKICRIWQHWDDLGLMRRTGAVPEDADVVQEFLDLPDGK